MLSVWCVAKAADTDPAAGKWVYLSAAIQVDAGGRAVGLSSVGIMTDDEGLAPLIEPIAAQLGSKVSVDYGIAYDNLLNAANARLNRPLKDGFRMEGKLSSAALQNVHLPADGIVIAVRASGELNILYGL